MFKSCLAGLALALALGGAQAEVTARHAYVSFDTVAAAQKNARADELVYFRGHITAEPEDGVYVFEDGTGNVRVEIPNEARTGVTLRRDVRYEVFGRALRLPFEELRVQAETLTPIGKRPCSQGCRGVFLVCQSGSANLSPLPRHRVRN